MTGAPDPDRLPGLEADNARLRWLLQQGDTPWVLRHRLRATLGLLRTIIRRSARTERPLPAYAVRLESRLHAVNRAQASAEQSGTVSLRALLVDEMMQHGLQEGERFVLSGPDVALPPRAGQILSLAMHELALNAVEHGDIGATGGGIEVHWSVAAAEPGQPLLLTWTEFGNCAKAERASGGFGIEVLTRMLPYDLRAETSLTFEPDRRRCTMRVPMPAPPGPPGSHATAAG